MRHIPIIWDYVALRIEQISSISNIDYVNLTANYSCLLSGEKDHELGLEKRGYTPEQLKSVKKKQIETHKKIMGLKFTKSLTKFKYPLLSYVLVLLENYEKGNLPFPGSTSEQPAQIIEMLNLIQAIKIDYQNKQQSQHKR